MAQQVGEAILSALIQTLLDSLATSPPVVNFFGKNEFLSKFRDELKVKLVSAKSLLNDAEDKQIKDVNVQTWVDELNEVLTVVDCLIEDINTEALRLEIEGKQVFDPKMDDKKTFEEIISSLDRLLKQKDFLGLKEGVQGKKLARSPAPLIKDSSDVYGRDVDKDAILKLLFPENGGGHEKISVILIVGMGGTGKTALARLIYNDSHVKSHFGELRAWVTVSDDFDVLKLAKLVLEELSGKRSEAKELGKLGDELKKFLGGKKFFLVLDDVWNENYSRWDSLKSYFEVAGEGSKIIVTTRNDKVALTMGSAKPHPLKPMSDDDCWNLFKKHAFHNVQLGARHDLEEIGKEIVKKCKGLPLAVMSVAGLLCSVSDPKEWKEILRSDVWELQEKGNDVILPSLWLSYIYLPSHVKRCFAYCSIFPKDHEYDKQQMIRLWMAEGLLQGEKMEDDGDGCINTLISRSLFQRWADDDSIFVMDDLVHGLATYVSGKDICSRFGMGNDSKSLTNKTQHLLCDGSKVNDCLEKACKGSSKDNHLHTFLALPSFYGFISDSAFDAFIRNFGRLRVLCLSGYTIKKIQNSIGKLKHLRYLDLSHTGIKRLPDSVCSLYNLQTLLLRHCKKLTCLPDKLDRLVKLRHLDISGTSIERLPDSVCSLYNLQTLLLDLSFTGIERLPDSVCSLYNLQTLLLRGCYQLTCLPDKVDRLVKLRHLDISGTSSLKKIPQQIYKLKALRTITKFVVGSDNTVTELRKFPYSCGRLEIDGLENIANVNHVLEARFQEKSLLTELELRWEEDREILDDWEKDREILDDWDKERAILDAMKPHTNLKKLFIDGYGGKELSDWIAHHSFSNITHVSLEDCTQCCQLPPFGQLPSLKVLQIDGLKSVKTISSEFYGPSGGIPFKSLEILQIKDMDELQSWVSFQAEAFPCLKKLFLNKCRMLNSTLPHSLPSLNNLRIYGCPEMEALLPVDSAMSTAFPSLRSLVISRCQKLKFSGLPLPTTLDVLTLVDCKLVWAQRMQWDLDALTRLKIHGYEEDSFPEEGLLPTTLIDLEIWDAPNLKELNGKAFEHLTSLKRLDIWLCPKLQSLPELPASLSLNISGEYIKEF